jgi:hypothetical protein
VEGLEIGDTRFYALVSGCTPLAPDKSPLRVCAVTRRHFPVGASPTACSGLETTGAGVEATKWTPTSRTTLGAFRIPTFYSRWRAVSKR